MPVIVKDTAVICFGRNDRGLPRLFGVRLSGSGDVTETNHAWQRDDISSFVPSPLAFQERVYMVRDQGQVECIAPTTGDTVWSDRFPKSRAKFYASPLIANGNLYAAREDGVVFVAKITDGKFELLSENDMGQSVIGSPVPTANQILIRGEKELRCYRNP
jgi:outer membrane protein assembly factor BamB